MPATDLVTVALVPLSTDRYHCLSMEGRWRATALYRTVDSVSRSGSSVTVCENTKMMEVLHLIKISIHRSREMFYLMTLRSHFRFTINSPGIVFTRTACDSSESEDNLLKRGASATRFSDDNLPLVLMPAELSVGRAQYLR